ncbi:MAG: hypothetical protein KDA80_03265, partial [Planctomycetaceae bacterium]|nr:hypothetical protein [Planctomycetaceae bacterium]
MKKQLPDREVEVRNAGIIGLASTPIVDLTSQAFSVKPDILVLYSGHNEFYGVGGVATNAPLSPLGIALGKSRLIRCLSGISTGRDANSSKGGPDLIETLPASYQIPAGSPLISRADSVFRTNIRRIINLCRQHKIPLVICTPVSNLRDQSPLVLEADMPILRKFEKPIQELTSQKQWKEL